jgi:predicted RNA binding protein YcfA (HicA-like mRNA interferase family)
MGSSRNLIKDLEKAGWELDRVSGSHHIFVKAGHLSISVPHPRADLGRGIEHKLRKAAGLK